MEWCNRFGVIGHWGYRTLRVAGGVTFWLSGAGKSVLEVVGVNLKDGQNVLVLWRLFGFLVWGSRCFSWLGPTMRMDKSGLKDETCWFCGDFLVCWCGEVGVGGGCFIASLCVVP